MQSVRGAVLYRHMNMCHMLTDSPEELRAMAERIGVARRWYLNSVPEGWCQAAHWQVPVPGITFMSKGLLGSGR